MSIKLDWVDRVASPDSHKVYRSTSKIDQGNLGSPLATLAGNALTYTDNTVQRGVVYHYVVTSIVGTDEAPSAEFVIAYTPYTGPGPQEIIRGNGELGYYGRIQLEDIISASDLVASCDLLGTGLIINPAANNYWHKVIYKGKILFFPNQFIATTLSYTTLYQRGLVFGNAPSASWPQAIKDTGGAPVAAKVLNVMNHGYVVRLPTSRESLAVTGITPAQLMGGEIDKVFACLYMSRAQNVDNLPQLDDSQSVIATNTSRLTADYHSGTGVNTAWVGRGATTAANGDIDKIFGGVLVSSAAVTVQWCPVLELVL